MKYCRYVILCVGVSAFAVQAHATDWLQFGFDAQHSGVNRSERGYSTSGNQLLFSVSVPEPLSTQPVYLSGVTTAQGLKDLVFFLGPSGTTYALDAATGAEVWHVWLSGAGYTPLRAGPALDPNRQFIYSVGLDGKVHKLNVADGTEVVDSNWPEISSSKPTIERVTSALTIATSAAGQTYLLVTSGSFGDGGDYQGHVTSINLQSGAQKVFNALCSNLFEHFVENGSPGVTDCNYASFFNSPNGYGMAAMWSQAGAVYDAQTDKIYVSTGNGPFNANTGGMNWGDSLLALNADASGSGMGWPTDSYTPTTFAMLYAQDLDLGLYSPAILPSSSAKYPHLAIQVGKDYCGRLINLDDMSGLHGPGHVGGELNGSCYPFSSSNQIAVWIDPDDHTTRLFDNGNEQILTFDSNGNPSLTPGWQVASTPSQSFLGTTAAVVANGTIYGVSPEAYVYAINAKDGTIEWSNEQFVGIGRWTAPIVINGRIYIPVSGNNSYAVWAFALDGVSKNGFE